MDINDGFIPSFITVPKTEPPPSPPLSNVDSAPLLTGDVPAFLIKLWKLVNNQEYSKLISWNESGTSFKVHNPSTFAKDVLPKYFKHSNFASFVRQLNMYGFRKVLATDHGGLKQDNEEWEFHHHNFQKGQSNQLPLVKRKGHPEDRKTKSQDLTKVLEEVKELKEKHQDFTDRLDLVTGENKLLWQHVNNLTKKNRRHEEVINKLIQFFVTLVYGKGQRLNSKKRLAIEDTPVDAKRQAFVTDITEPAPLNSSAATSYSVQSPVDVSTLLGNIGDIAPSFSRSGPQIIVLPSSSDGQVTELLPSTLQAVMPPDETPSFPSLDDTSLESIQSKLDELQSQLPPSVSTTDSRQNDNQILTTPEIGFNRSISWEKNPDDTVSPVVDGLNLDDNISTIDDKLRAFQDKLGVALDIDPSTWNEIFSPSEQQTASTSQTDKIEIIDEGGNRELTEYSRPFSPSQFLNEALEMSNNTSNSD